MVTAPRLIRIAGLVSAVLFLLATGGGRALADAPTVTGISPGIGFTSAPKPQTISINGTNFVVNNTQVMIGGQPAVNVMVSSSVFLTATLPTASSAGMVDVHVITPDGTADGGNFTYELPIAPTITMINPSTTPTTGLTQVTISGSNFIDAPTVTFGGQTAEVTMVSSDGSTITVTTPPGSVGATNVVVTTGGGTATTTNLFTYTTAVPSVLSVTSPSGSTVGTNTVTISGASFTGATAVTFGGFPATGVVVTNDGLIQAIVPAHAAGVVDVVVTTPGGMGTGKALYTYVTPAPPTLTLVNPFNGSTLGGTSVTITGTSFLGVTSVTFDGLSATGVTVNSAGTMIVATSPAHAAGAVSVAITAPGGMIAGSYTYITLPPGAPPPPTVVSISPASGSTLGGTSVTITGTNFTGTPQLTIGGSAATGVTVVDGMTIKATTPAHATGLTDVMVITTAGTATGTGLYSYATPALPPPPPPPTVSGITPNSGTTAGGTSVTISGANLTGATSVTIGGHPATGVTVNGSGTSITATTPPGSLGAANVMVTTPGGTVTGPGPFTYVTLPPTVTAVSPATGSTLGGTSVTITGTNFTGASAVTIGGVTATAVSVFSATTITATTPAGSAGAANVVVTTPAGTSGTSGNSRYTYVTSAAPTVTAITANSGTTAGGTSVTITGTNFTGATTASIGGIAATFVTVVNATTITAATPAHAAGAVSVTVTTPAGTGTGTNLFTYVAQPATISGISPNSGTTLGGAAITITGANLTGATAVTFGGIAATNVTVNGGGTSINALTPAHAIGAVSVIVTTPVGSATAAGTYLYVPPTPTVTSITPNSGTTLGGTPVTITGANFTGATAVTIGGVPATGVTVNGSGTISATTPAHAPGPASVVVTTPGGTGTGTNLFTYVTPLPAVSAISPISGTTAGGTPVTITGANFTGATAVTIGGVPATGVTVSGSGTISATTPAHAPGPASVVVTTPGGTGTVTGNYTYVPPTATITSISPSSGTTLGGTSITITGANFAGATAVAFGGLAATSFTVNGSGTSITAITPAHIAGAVSVAVTTPGGPGTTGSYTYVTLAAPTVTTVTPPDGPVTGGTFITITGTNFVQGATTVTIGGVAVTGLTVVSSTTMTATTPAHAAGSSEVNVTTPGGSDPVSFTYDPLNADSLKLRKLQIAFTPVVAQASGAAISGAVQDAIGAGFSDSTQECIPNGNGFTCHFAGDREEHVAVLERPVRSFDSETDPRMSRVDDAFSALAGAGNVVKTPPRPVVAPQRDWLGWVDFRGTSFSSSGAGDTTSGLQVNATAGLTRKLNPNFLVGILAGYEHFNYTEQVISGRLTGDGWTVGTYLGWRITPTLRFDALLAGSDIGYAGVAGTASGNYSGERLLASGTLTGTYGWQAIVLEPSAQVYGLLENENQYTDTLGTIQTARSFETGRASSGMKVSLPFAASDSMNLTPFVGLYADYYFTSDNASVTGLNSVPLLQGSSARATGGLAMTFGGGSQVAVDGEYDGIGGNAHVWTYRARGSVPF
jgi:IPT/TIG domain-containing protein